MDFQSHKSPHLHRRRSRRKIKISHHYNNCAVNKNPLSSRDFKAPINLTVFPFRACKKASRKEPYSNNADYSQMKYGIAVNSVIFSSINAIIHLTVYGAGTTSLLSITYTYPHHSYGALFLCLKGIKTTAQGLSAVAGIVRRGGQRPGMRYTPHMVSPERARECCSYALSGLFIFLSSALGRCPPRRTSPRLCAPCLSGIQHKHSMCECCPCLLCPSGNMSIRFYNDGFFSARCQTLKVRVSDFS